MNRTVRRILSVLAALCVLLPSCIRRTGSSPAEEAEQNDIISFLNEEPNGQMNGKKGQNAQAASSDSAPHPLFYLNGVWSATGAYDDDLYYDYDEIDEMSLVFENGWVALTAGGSTSVYQVETEGDMLFFTVSGGSELGDARVVIDYYDNGYLLGLIPENDPAFELLFERQ